MTVILQIEMRSLQRKGVVPTSSGQRKPHYKETCSKRPLSRFNPFNFIFAVRSQKAQRQATTVSAELSLREPGDHSTLQERDPKEILTFHYSVVKRLQVPILLVLPLSPMHSCDNKACTRPCRCISESQKDPLSQAGLGVGVFPTIVGTL